MTRKIAGVPVVLAAGALVLLPAGRVSAADSIVGGYASLCSTLARADRHTSDAIEICTDALLQDLLQGHVLAATYVNRATMFIGAANYGAALKDVDEALAVEPTLGAAYVNRGGALLGLGQFRQSETEIDKGLALNPEEPEKAYANRALARWHQDNIKGAYEDFMKAVELKPGWAWPKEQLTHFTVTVRPRQRQP